ncbi:uncharacterized protein LOC126781086 [Nymphalis io]|uniref:uncharacterized protein LOC126781086 n=1 Tax=Inachis io TaxID=171585 RepID=UPI00216940BA|nr:uncharacterized protein LOC126781086 [Nymphalis io]
MKVEVLESWVSDLVAQNTLLASTVEELETEVTSRLLEKRRHAEIEIELRAEADTLRRHLARKDSDLRGLLEVLRRLREFDFYAIDGIHFNEVTESDIFGSVMWQKLQQEQGDNKTAINRQDSKKMQRKLYKLYNLRDKNKMICDKVNEMKVKNDSLKKENLNKDREIRRLNKDLQHYEQTIMSLRNELSMNNYQAPDIPKKDAEVMADISAENRQECDDVEPVKESELAIEEHPVYQERMQQLEQSAKVMMFEECDLKASVVLESRLSSDFRSLRHENVALREKLSAMQRVCMALDEQCHVAALRAQFKDEVIHEMRRQLRQAKAKSPSPPILISDSSIAELDGVPIEISDVACDCVPCPFALKETIDKVTSKVKSSSSEKDRELDSSILFTNIGTEIVYREIKATREREASDLHKLLSFRDEDSLEVRGRVEQLILSEYCCKMMFNGLFMYGDSDTSDFTKDSIASSIESAASDAARACSLENKLMATMQILKNKEETIRVQAESLSLAEARIAALNSKCQQSASKLHQAQQTNSLNLKRSSVDGNIVEMADVSTMVADSNIVDTLRDNLSVIEEFYRECFYETAKQEELITMLRRSYLDMKLVERQKSDHIDFLQNTLKSQKSSIERYEDIAMEVENLKTEISNFINNSSNNDSGVWGCEPAAELRDIARQLCRLRDMLRNDCICGLAEENVELKRRNASMETQLRELQQRVTDLEAALEDKENMDQQYQKQTEVKEKELQRIRQQLMALEQGSRDQGSACDTLTFQLKQLEGMLNDKTAELLNSQQLCKSQEVTIRDLREELHKADLIVTENRQVRAEVSSLSAQVTQWRDQLAESRRRLRALEDELRLATDHCRHLAAHYREKAATARTLQAQLGEAQRRGAELCADTQRAVRGVRRCLAEQRARRRAQDDKIKELEMTIRTLRSTAGRPSASENDPCCSKYLSRVEVIRSDRSCVGASETPGCSKCAYSRGSMPPSSESGTSRLPPTPPRRLLRKKPLCLERVCQFPVTREAGVQRPPRHDELVDARLSYEHSTHSLQSYDDTPSRESSPEQLLRRVERAHDALCAARRGGRAHTRTPTRTHTRAPAP